MATIIHKSDRHEFRLMASGVAGFDFAGGDITSHAGIAWVHDLCEALGVRDTLSKHLASHPGRRYDDSGVAYFRVLSLCVGEVRDCCADWLRDDPLFQLVTGGVPSQETVSRRLSSMTADDAERLRRAICEIMDRVATVRPKRDLAVVDLDSTLLDTFGKQDKAKYNTHYDAVGYHPLLATDTARREVAGVLMRGGTDYCCKGAADFWEAIASDMERREPGIGLCVRGDSGFATPEIYDLCERRGDQYVIRMKNNRKLVAAVDARLAEPMRPGVPRTVTGELWYRAGSWRRHRRIVFEVTQPEGQLLPEYMIIVTNSHARCKDVIRFYKERGEMEQLVGEYKSFASGCVGSRSFDANDFRCQLALLAHCLVAWMRSLCLPESVSAAEPATIIRDYLRFGAKVTSHSRRHTIRVATAYPRKRDLAVAAHRIWEVSLVLAA